MIFRSIASHDSFKCPICCFNAFTFSLILPVSFWFSWTSSDRCSISDLTRSWLFSWNSNFCDSLLNCIWTLETSIACCSACFLRCSRISLISLILSSSCSFALSRSTCSSCSLSASSSAFLNSSSSCCLCILNCSCLLSSSSFLRLIADCDICCVFNSKEISCISFSKSIIFCWYSLSFFSFSWYFSSSSVIAFVHRSSFFFNSSTSLDLPSRLLLFLKAPPDIAPPRFKESPSSVTILTLWWYLFAILIPTSISFTTRICPSSDANKSLYTSS